MFISFIFLILLHAGLHPTQAPTQAKVQTSSLTGVYRIDIPASDKLYSVIEGASSNVPFGEQQRFFIDLALRLTPPDLLAIEQHGIRISLGSSRAPRMVFVADGVARNIRAKDGHVIKVKFSVEGVAQERIIFTSNGRTEDNFTVVFEIIGDGKLRVVRRIEAEALDQPLVIQTIYNKISDVAQWDLYGESQTARAATAAANPTAARPVSSSAGSDIDVKADTLQKALTAWINATNARDIDKQMSFYVPRLKAYYLTRDTSADFVREEKSRVFTTARLIDIRAAEPEIMFQDGGRIAVMRYRKQYRIVNGKQSRSGQVIQELRWQRTPDGWRIFSERDIRVLR